MTVMEGPLSKWTNVMKGWQYRWFVLDDSAGLLSYYTVIIMQKCSYSMVFIERVKQYLKMLVFSLTQREGLLLLPRCRHVLCVLIVSCILHLVKQILLI